MLTRRDLIALFAPAVSIPYRDYARCLPDHLAELAQAAWRRRESAITELTSPPAVARRQEWVRDTFWRLIGGKPEISPLNLRQIGSFSRDGYRVDKVLYESFPEVHIPGLFYVPLKARPPFPGVLFQMGHSLNGKAYESYQRCCQALAKLGYLVLAFDPMGQGERTYYPDRSGQRTRLSSADDEHTTPGRQMLLNGDTATRLQLWDAVRSLDVLAAHPQVDPKRLASTGQSGGGTLTMMLGAVDNRLAVAMVSMGNTENFACQGFLPPGSTDDAEQDFVYSGPAGFDRWDLLYPLAPKPLLIGVSARDFFGTYSPSYLRNGREEYAKLERVYQVLEQPDKIAWYESPLPHGLSYDSRLQVYNWFGRWLKGNTPALKEEPPTAPEPDAVLYVAPTGNVVRSFGGTTPFRRNRDLKPTSTPADLTTLLRMPAIRPDARITQMGSVPSAACRVSAIEVRTAEEVWVPAWRFEPARPDASKPLLILLEPSGRNGRWREGQLYQNLASRGFGVIAPDLRGIGDLTPQFGPGAAGYTRSHQSEENYSWASLMLGEPLVTQRVVDILSLVTALRSDSGLANRSIAVAARGGVTVPALVAASLEPAVARLYLAGGLISYRSIVEEEEYTHSLADFVPGILLHTDLPQIAATLHRPLTLAGAVDAANRPLETSTIRGQYTNPAIRILPSAEWTENALSAFATAR